METRELKFINSDATPKEQVLRVDTASIDPIMAWYGAYYAGDRYRVLVDGVKVEKDQNGELVSNLSNASDEIARLPNQFTDAGCDHDALNSAVGVLRTQQAQPHKSTQAVLWEAIKDYAERA